MIIFRGIDVHNIFQGGFIVTIICFCLQIQRLLRNLK